MSNEQFSCIICTDTFNSEEMTVLECSHHFCHKCIREWRAINPTCPMCREEIISVTVPHNIDIQILGNTQPNVVHNEHITRREIVLLSLFCIYIFAVFFLLSF